MRRSSRFAFVVSVAIALSACGSATGPAAGLGARATWEIRGPASYSYQLFRSCECTPAMGGPVVVEVRNGVVESRHYVSTGASVDTAYAARFPTVEGLFTIVEQAANAGVSPVVVSYDATLGYPKRIQIGDPAVDGPVLTVSEFVAR
jgi:hypothetical protein